MATKSLGKVKAVVLINIAEDSQSKQTLRKSVEARPRIQDLMTQFGNAKAKVREGIEHGGSGPESDAKQYNTIHLQCELLYKIELALLGRRWKCGIWSMLIPK
jgi:hypothetical protein